MPAYNSENYITYSINSVISQTYKNWELIIVDDGSKDSTMTCIESLATGDNRIKVYKNTKNIGVSETRNKAISLAKGEWIAFLDSDDLWAAEKLDKQIAFSQRHHVDFVFTGARFINAEGRNFRWNMPVPQSVTYSQLLKQNVIMCSSVLVKKKLLIDKKMIGDRIHEDFALWLEILKNDTIAYGINEPLLTYRIYIESKSGNKIKSIIMSYRTYRCIGLSFITSIYYLCNLVKNGMKKYACIYSIRQ